MKNLTPQTWLGDIIVFFKNFWFCERLRPPGGVRSGAAAPPRWGGSGTESGCLPGEVFRRPPESPGKTLDTLARERLGIAPVQVDKVAGEREGGLGLPWMDGWIIMKVQFSFFRLLFRKAAVERLLFFFFYFETSKYVSRNRELPVWLKVLFPGRSKLV